MRCSKTNRFARRIGRRRRRFSADRQIAGESFVQGYQPERHFARLIPADFFSKLLPIYLDEPIELFIREAHAASMIDEIAAS
jgi:hypothetical protein